MRLTIDRFSCELGYLRYPLARRLAVLSVSVVPHDLIGYFPWFVPKHVKQILHTGEDIREGVRKWVEELKRS